MSDLKALTDSELEDKASSALFGEYKFTVGASLLAIGIAKFLPRNRRLAALIPCALIGTAIDFRSGQLAAEPFKAELDRRKAAGIGASVTETTGDESTA